MSDPSVLVVDDKELETTVEVGSSGDTRVVVTAARRLEITLAASAPVGACVTVIVGCPDAFVTVAVGAHTVAVSPGVAVPFYNSGGVWVAAAGAERALARQPHPDASLPRSYVAGRHKPVVESDPEAFDATWDATHLLSRGIDAAGSAPAPAPAPVPLVSFTADQVAKLYGFPTAASILRAAPGSTLAIIELGGAYSGAAHTTYFTKYGLPVPSYTEKYIDGAVPGSLGSADSVEVALDVQVAGAVAPANTLLALYYAPNTWAGFEAAVRAAVSDKVTVISISWGAPESSVPSAAIVSMNKAFAEARAAGIPVFCATGDNGATDGVGDRRRHADFPASSPNVIACGGTSLRATAAAILGETAWTYGGGGFSTVFSVPPFQKGKLGTTATQTRGIPDVSGNADPYTGYMVKVGNFEEEVVGGTSAVAPLYAALAVVLKASGSRAVWPDSLYAAPAVCADVTSGANTGGGPASLGYKASTGWDPVTGLGRLTGAAVSALKAPAPAPKPAPAKPSAGGPSPHDPPGRPTRPFAGSAGAKPPHVPPAVMNSGAGGGPTARRPQRNGTGGKFIGSMNAKSLVPASHYGEK